jgi:hypothetical protein
MTFTLNGTDGDDSFTWDTNSRNENLDGEAVTTPWISFRRAPTTR